MNTTPSERSFSQRFQERIARSRFFTFSLLLHTVIVILAGSAVLFHRKPEAPDFTGPPSLTEKDEVVVKLPILQPVNTVPNAPAPQPSSISTSPLNAIVSIKTNPQMSMLPFSPTVPGIGDRMPIDRNPITAPVHKVPGLMAARMGADARRRAATDWKQKPKSELAVVAGLHWLKDHQNTDGSWSDEYKPAMTGLALLSFLGHGELPESPDFGEAVKKALDWVLERGTEYQGRMSLTKDGWGGNHGVYEHAILTYAMGEYFSMTGDRRFEPLLRQAVGYIVDGQNPLGGWDYQYAKGPRNDLSVAGWQIQALKAAHLTGLGIRGVDEALEKSVAFIKKWRGGEGGFGYDKPDNRPSLTGVGVLCIYFWKGQKDDVVRDGISYLLGSTEVKYKGNSADLYAWYYDTQACLMFGGSEWAKWNRMFQDEIVSNQSLDGSWPPTAGAHLQPKPAGAGPCYRTTLCVLMLEAYYRYAPTNK